MHAEDRQDLVIKALAVMELRRRNRNSKHLAYTPYKKQREFHAAGEKYRQRLLRAGNQQGKTYGGAMEMTYHLTGQYPEWWQGRRWDRPIVAWAGSNTGETTRDNPQRALFGIVGDFGSGSIPENVIHTAQSARGIANLLDYAKIRHQSGGYSTLRFKYYEQGREKWQGPPVDCIWLDEEAPAEIYSEALARTIATNGMIYTTFTPLLGMTEVIRGFLLSPNADQIDINMTIEDAEHIPPEERERIIASFPAHEREARARGVPILGSGRIFQVDEDLIKVDPFDIPSSWAQIGGLDFGWDHPSAAVRLAWDRDSDTFYVIAAHRAREQTPIMMGATLRAWGDWLPWAWPHDGLQHDKGSGDQLKEQYAAAGLKMIDQRATFDDGSNGVEAGILEMLDLMQTGRFKVFRHLNDWFEEFRLYHRKDGKIVKQADDLLCLHPDTEVITDQGIRRIADLVGTTGKVLSINGAWADYKNCRMTRKNADLVRLIFSDESSLVCTPDHKVLSTDGKWVEAINSAGISCHNAVSHSREKKWTKSSIVAPNTRALETIIGVLVSFYTGLSGKIQTAKSRPAITYTTRMVTKAITPLKTLSCFMEKSIYQRITKGIKEGLMLQSRRKPYGVKLHKGRRFYRKWAEEISISCARMASFLASVAGKNLSPVLQVQTGFAAQHVRRNGGVTQESTTSTRLVRFVTQNSEQASLGRQKRVRFGVGENYGCQPLREDHTLTVLRVINAGKSDVFCMEVPETNAFSISNGVVVHNCATRYALMMRRFAITAQKSIRKSSHIYGVSGGWMT